MYQNVGNYININGIIVVSFSSIGFKEKINFCASTTLLPALAEIGKNSKIGIMTMRFFACD